MSFSVVVHSSTNQFEVTLVGAPDVCATAPTREEALDALEKIISKQLEKGELVELENRKQESAPRVPFLDPNDPLEKEFIEELNRQRKLDLSQCTEEP